MKDANYAPVYCALYPELCTVARKHGYALAIHGTLSRDMDLICIPWVESPSNPQAVVDELVATFALRQIGAEPTLTLHNRLIYTISVSFGECFIDLSFMPILKTKEISL